MKLINLFRASICLPLLILITLLGISLPLAVVADPVSDKKRFDKVAGQLDLGGVLYGYVSVDGDLSGLAKFANSFMSGMKEIDKGVSSHVPDVDVESLMKISASKFVADCYCIFLSKSYVGKRFRLQIMLEIYFCLQASESFSKG